MRIARNLLRRTFGHFGYDLRRRPKTNFTHPVELQPEEAAILSTVVDNHFSMTHREGLFATLLSVKYAIENKIPGDFVECGVWRGGNSIIAAKMFELHGEDRKTYLFDTFAGMTAPTDEDIYFRDHSTASHNYAKLNRGTHTDWCYASLEDVKANFATARVRPEAVRFIKGDVLETLSRSENLPETICVLRLDTDWYESTKKEFEVLYPRLSNGGAFIVDDYGCWAGAKKATDEFFASQGHRPLLSYIDFTGRVGVKTR